MTKGYRGTKSRLVKVAQEAMLHAGQYAYHGRKLRKQDFRTLWITRIGEAAKLQGLSYSKFINMLKQANVELDRKILSHMINEDPAAFKHIVDTVKNK